MSVRPIVMLGDPRLRLKGLPVDSFGKYLHELLDDLAHTMRDAPGVGLAAPQLGEALQACVIEVESQLYELVNPQIVRATATTATSRAASRSRATSPTSPATSASGSSPRTARASKIKVAGSGLLGRALQHELDHLDGKLYIDYLESMDELMAVGDGRRGRRRGPRGDERPGVTDRAGPASGADRLPRERRVRRREPAAPVEAPRRRLVGVVTAPPRPAGRKQQLTATPIHGVAPSARRRRRS